MRAFFKHPGVFVALAVVALAVPEAALSRPTTDVAGDWTGTTKSRVRVASVGGDRATAGNDLVVFGNGLWDLHDTSRGWFYTGSWAQSRNRLTWSFDAAGRDELVSMLESWAAAHGVDSTVSLTRVKTKGKGKDGRNGKSLKVTTVAKFTLSARGRSRRGSLKMVGKFRPD